jgi:putative endonuclease
MDIWFVYIVQCSDESLYTGITNNIEKRIEKHNKGIGAKAVKGKLPVKLVYQEFFADKGEALRREYEIKSWSREKKLQIISM